MWTSASSQNVYGVPRQGHPSACRASTCTVYSRDISELYICLQIVRAYWWAEGHARIYQAKDTAAKWIIIVRPAEQLLVESGHRSHEIGFYLSNRPEVSISSTDEAAIMYRFFEKKRHLSTKHNRRVLVLVQPFKTVYKQCTSK
jgi:hypothetical protein